ncbi:FecCD family ABC transporter permease [Halomonas sp. KAO]|uniref:FecCD family ABC transporter permease n=1 Tax=Halomonas sp. KAO TaxID=2783858 RepID=UPI001E63782F|nr:iron ABC transporter permease [Halomonas sp. KAO]
MSLDSAIAMGRPVAADGFQRREVRHRAWLLAGAGMLLAAFLADLLLGPGGHPLGQVLEALLIPEQASPLVRITVWQLRLPTALLAVLAGAGLAVAGAQMQTVLDNPLADPFTLGLASAASFGAALAVVAGISLLPLAGHLAAAGNAFVFSLVAAGIIHSLSRLRGVGLDTLVLLGIATMFTFNALLGLLQYLASPDALQQLVFWSLGSLSRPSGLKLGLIAAVLAGTLLLSHRLGWQLGALRLGSIQAQAMGVPVARLRLGMLAAMALLTAVVVAAVGTIGFVGLVAPHMARLLVGEQQRHFLPLSALCGATLMCIADLLSKLVVPGLVLPIGIITALAGLPAFFLLILRRRPS